MRDIIAGAGWFLMLFAIGCFDSEDLTIPVIMLGVSFVLMGIAGLIEWKEEYGGRRKGN
ncbi:MAG: hypothetical protein ACI4J1_10285 [Ruminiclostridium sp.]